MTNNSFEATYPRYDFAPLVRIGLAVAAMINRRRRAKEASVGQGAVGSAA